MFDAKYVWKFLSDQIMIYIIRIVSSRLIFQWRKENSLCTLKYPSCTNMETRLEAQSPRSRLGGLESSHINALAQAGSPKPLNMNILL
jgi:hypothetical protein